MAFPKPAGVNAVLGPFVRKNKAKKTDIRKFFNRLEEAASLPSSLQEGQTCLEYHATVGEEDVPRQAVILEKLGDIYKERVTLSPLESGLYLKGAALYNMALARCTHKKHRKHIVEQLLELEKRYLEFIAKLKRQQIAARASSGPETAKKATDTLRSLRSNVSHRLEKVLLSWKQIEVSEDRAAMRAQESGLRKEIYTIRKIVRETMKALWAEIVYDVIWVLGPPPCKYAIIALGEMALDELTPYSDAKFAILLERNEKPNINYFAKFATYLKMKVTSIGETPMTSSGVKVIYDFYNKGLSALFDPDTPNGVKIDSMDVDRLWQTLEDQKVTQDGSGIANRHGILVGLPRDIARVQMEAAERGYGRMSSDLLNVMMIEGEQHIYQGYCQNLDIFLMSQTMRFYLANAMLDDTLGHFQLKPYVDYQETDIQLNRVFLELNALPYVIQCLKLIHGLHAETEWKIIEALKSNQLISEEGEHDLKMAICLSYFLRTRVEMENNGKNGAKHILKQDAEHPNERFDAVKSVFKLQDSSILLRAYSALLPLIDYVRNFHLTKKKQSLLSYDFYDTSPWVVAHLNYRIQRFDLAIDAMKIGVTRMTPEEQIETYIRLSIIALHIRDGKDANMYLTQAMDIKESILDPPKKLFIFIRVWLYMAMVHLLDGKRKRAMQTCAEARDMWLKLVGDGEEERLRKDPQALEFYISFNELMATIMMTEGRETEAATYIQKVVLYCGRVTNPETSDDLRRARRVLDLSAINIARCEFKTALTNLRQAYRVYVGLYGHHRSVLQVATVLRLLGEALEGLGKPTSATCYKANAYLYVKWVLGPGLPKKPITTFTSKSRQLNVEVFVAIKEAGFCQFAAKHYEEALRSFQTITILGTTVNGGKGSDWDIVQGEVYKGRCVENTGKLNKSIQYYQAVLERYLDKQFYGINGKNVYIAWCYSNLARVYKKLHMLDEAKEHFKTSLSIYRDIVADKFTQSCIADDLIQMAEIYESSQEYDRAVKLLKECVDIRTQLFGHAKIHQKIAIALQKLGLVESQMGDTRSAISHLDQALDMYYRSFGEGTASEELASVLYDLGIVYKEADYHAKATRSLIKSLDMRKQLHGDAVPHDKTIQTVKLLSDYQRENDDTKDALATHKYWLTLVINKYGKSHVEVAKVYGLIGAGHLKLKKWKDAVKAYEAAVRIHRKEVGEEGDTIEVANWFRDLVLAYKKAKKKEKSRQANEQHLAIRTRVLGRDAVDEDLVDSITRAAEAYELRGEYQKALSYRKKALKKARLLHGDEPHLDVVNCLDALIRIYLKISECDNALHYHNQLMTLRNALHQGKHCQELAEALKRSGDIYSGIGKYLQAITQYEAALAMYEALKMQPQSFPEVIDAYSGLGNALVNMGNCERAGAILDNAVKFARQLKPPTASSREILANALYSMAWNNESHPNFERARELHREALALRRKVFDSENLNTLLADSYRAVGRTSCATGRPVEGLKALTEALVLLRRIHGEETVREDICQVTIELGQACAAADRPEEGVLHLTKALHMLRQLRGTDKPHFHVARCLNILADVCKQAQRYDAAIQYANKALDMYGEILSKKHSDHPTVASIMTLVGDVYMDTKRYKEAVKHYKRAAHIALVIHAGNDLSKDVQRSMEKYKAALALEEATATTIQTKVPARRYVNKTN